MDAVAILALPSSLIALPAWARRHPQISDHLSSPAARPLKTRQTVWGVISDDAGWDTRLCSCVACLAPVSNSSMPTGRCELKCATPTVSDSPGRSELRVCGVRAPSRIALREAYSELVVSAANCAPLSRPMTS